MSWMKQGQSGGGPAPQPHTQNVGNHQNMYPNYQSVSGNTPQQQYWQPPAQQTQQHFGQQYGQGYTQEYPPNNANQFYQQSPQYNQNYAGFNNQQQNYPQNYYQNQTQQNYGQNPATHDGWEDNWDWGWEESAKQAQKTQSMPSVPQEQAFNNANVIEESFATTDSWNWAMDDKKENKDPQPTTQQTKPELRDPPTVPVNTIENSSTSQVNIAHNINNTLEPPTEEVKTLNDRDVVKEKLPNLAAGKRFHLDNLTPQWSIESQMSQDSSDGPHTHSEGTYRSDTQSRNSNSPGPNIDNSNSTYTQPGFDETYTKNNEWSRQSDEHTLTESAHSTSRRESHDELSNSLHEMSLGNHVSNTIQPNMDSVHRNIDENKVPPQSISPANFPPPISGGGPPMSTMMPPPPPVSSSKQLPPRGTTPPVRPPSASLPPLSNPSAVQTGPSSSSHQVPPTSVNLPPPNFPHPSNSQNPFKNAGSFSHKSTNKISASSSGATGQPFPMQLSNTNLASPAVVHKISQQSRTPLGFEANLETTPDNSERPDQPHISPFRPKPPPQTIPDNLEVAPQNDRNEYLQTAHLSSGDYGENTDFTRNLPPPGLRRMVVGQQESEYTQNLNVSGDEPPPGLSRMVPGQQTEADNVYNQPPDNYLDRHIDGQPTEPGGRPYRQADGHQTADSYVQPPGARSGERRPVGLDRMVPGEPSNNEYSQYPSSAYGGGNEARVVTGLDRDFPIHIDANPNVREQNVDGSEYREDGLRNVIASREAIIDAPQEYNPPPDDRQREITMEGENLQDLSVVSSADLTFSRDQTVDGADLVAIDAGPERNDASDSPERPATSSRRHSLSRVTSTPDESDREHGYKNKDRHKSSRDRDRDKEGRYSRGDRKYEREERGRGERRDERRDERRGDKDRRDRERRDRDDSPESRRHRRSTRSRRYDTEDTDYYSDRERDRRSYREGSYREGYGKPPRRGERARRYERDDERYERRYRDIDPTRTHATLRRDRDDIRRRVTFSRDAKTSDNKREGGTYSPGAAGGTDEETRERRPDRRSRHRRPDPYYDVAGYGGGYMSQRQYEYYEQLRRTDPAAYMILYKQLMAGHAPLYADVGGYGGGVERGEERGSGHSGRSSANGKGIDTSSYRVESLRDAASLRTDLSDRELTTDASLNLQLEESTVRSERMTPFRYSTAHTKGSVSSRDIVLVCGSYPVDGAPATVRLLSLAAATRADPQRALLQHAPGPLLKGVTHKKTVIEYCEARAAEACSEGGADPAGYALLWGLLALLLRQNGVVVGSDIAELLMRNVREYPPALRPPSADRAESLPPAEPEPAEPPVDEGEALDKLRDYLIYGNRQDALEWAMSRGLWAHALALGGASERRTRAAVAARFIRSVPPADPLHTLYALAYNVQPPALTGAADERWGDWRPHAAVLLANTPHRPDQEIKALTQLGDSVRSRGLGFSAQFCYVCAGGPWSARLGLLGEEGRAVRPAQAPTRAILATEIYEYARSLAGEYVLPELQVYKLVVATRLCDCGEYARALAYVESCARALRTFTPPPQLVRAVAELADRLSHHDPTPDAEEDSSEGSPRHQHWLDEVKSMAHSLQAESASVQSTPQHQLYSPQQQYSWGEQASHQPAPQYEAVEPVAQSYADPDPPPPDYSQYYQPVQPALQPLQPALQPGAPPIADQEEQPPSYSYDHWPEAEESAPQPYTDYWQPQTYGGYGEGGAVSGGIRMPGAAPAADHDDDQPDHSHQQREEADATKQTKKGESKQKEENGKSDKGKGGGWLGGILTKLSLRPPNQMILPDDKNPTIVWDEENKRWRNLDGEGTEGDQPPPPPPKTQDLAPLLNRSASPPLQAGPPGAPPTAPPVSNIFKMQKGRHIKKSYVDVLNPGGGRGPAPAPLAPPPPPQAPLTNYFVPQPTAQWSVVPIPPSPPPPARPPAPPSGLGGVYDPAHLADSEPRHSGI